MFGLFAKKPTPEEMVRKWTSGIRAQQRGLDRQMANIKTEEKKAEQSIKQLAKKGDVSSCKILAKELVRSRKQRERVATSKAQLNSISLELNYQASKLKVIGSLQKSTQVMKAVNQLMSVPQLQRTLMEMSREMMKAGLIDEMTGDMMDALDDEDLEEEAEEEVDRVLAEVTDGALGEIRAAPARTAVAAHAAAESDAESELDLEDMQARLSALRS
ncbi:Vacuolar protein-sorting-associated protein 24 [Coemansia nantahalensis]|uniref:Vacuolar protein-sorting-associated protein 24 n=2 Tax=Coemansia TaxID=4863 RepID=A0ACC1L8N3_9FUNG|nr:Vacuolar protein-sorting-associated protein 24 [Coemansia nantahalensis]KAJ2772779.1 Vacuolar protein-sorting-associated protein 24 [Coemansia nantahalensis]KAJ2803091.1 Vacuolar protein-sorting-associated protein 24 [Coemansia helicoidea]